MQKIEEAAEKGELDELVLMVIRNRLDLARCDVSNTCSICPKKYFPFLVVYISFHSQLTALTA